ncbi:MAG: lipid-A-disaccharide synthase [Thermodesulfovibrionales bacterium]|jgi:lipid-A-disaccharide synthase
MKTVMIVAGESSGELYGSLLAKQLRHIWPDVTVIGIGGERMRAAGVKILSGISSAFGITELLTSIKRIRESFKTAAKALATFKPEVVVLIDFPDFNFRLGAVAKRHGLKVLYYVSPQVWAWRKGRVKTMGEIADRIAVILPFEKEIYTMAGIPCEFVGHPAMEEIDETQKTEDSTDPRGIKMRESLGLSEGRPVIALLPGSRAHELKTLLPVFIELTRMVAKEFPDGKCILPLAPNIDADRFAEDIATLKREGVLIVRGDSIKCLASSDVAVVASGTATLQAALMGIPLVVVYKLSLFSYLIGKALLSVKHISLVNIIAGEEVVRELIQRRAKAENIVQELKRILNDDQYRSGMTSSMTRIRDMFSGRQPSRRVAEIIGELAGWKTSER